MIDPIWCEIYEALNDDSKKQFDSFAEQMDTVHNETNRLSGMFGMSHLNLGLLSSRVDKKILAPMQEQMEQMKLSLVKFLRFRETRTS